jgi:hypothetical protein
MAIRSNICGDTCTQYIGCVLDTFERNGYHDSDFYAVCWDEAKSQVVTIEYDTTRCGGGGTAEIDATEDVLAKAYRYYKGVARHLFDTIENERLAKKIAKGDEVEVIRARKIAKGTIGKVFWSGSAYNHYTYRNELRVGIKVGDNSIFLPLDYVVKHGWEEYMLTGKARKQAIRNATINSMPYHYRKLFR